MTALVRMRLAALVRTGLALAPALGALVVLGVLYGGGQARPAEAYGVSAVILFPVLAWQTKILLDVEPDVQRRLALVATGSRRREVGAGLLAAGLASVPVIVVALALPWLLNGVTLAHGGPGLGAALLLGLWVHAVAVPPAVALGAFSSRVVAGNAGRAVAILAGGVVLVIILGTRRSPAPWLAPPLLSVARALAGDQLDYAALGPLTLWAILWAAVALSAYAWLRRTRA